MLPDRPDEQPALDADDAPDLDDALAEAHRAVLAREERRRTDRRSGLDRRGPTPTAVHPAWLAAATGSWLLVFLLLISPPAFLRPPDPAPFRPSDAAAEASLRFGLWLADHRVQRFLAREGRLPSSLDEAGIPDPAIVMEVTGGRSYRLLGRRTARVLVLTDAMAADSFLGGSVEQLRRE